MQIKHLAIIIFFFILLNPIISFAAITNDTTPPQFLNIIVTIGPPETELKTYNFYSIWTDDVGISDVVFEFNKTNFSFLAGQISHFSFLAGQEFPYENAYTINITNLSMKTYNYKWYANDTSNNWNEISTFTADIYGIIKNATVQFPSEEILLPPPKTDVVLPEGGLKVRVNPNVLLILFPLTSRSATILNVTSINPNTYKVLLCNQTSLASYEIEIVSDLAYFCVNYSGLPVEEPTINIFKFEKGSWISLRREDISVNPTRKIVCGRVESTPYMVTGFQPTTTSKLALSAMIETNISITLAKEKGLIVDYALDLFKQALNAYYVCDYSSAKSLAERAAASILPVPVWLIIVNILAVVILVVYYFRLKRAVKIEVRNV